MKIEMNDNSMYSVFWVSVVALLIGVVVAGLIYNHHKNELILKADTCEKAAFIEGAYSERVIAICKLKTQL